MLYGPGRLLSPVKAGGLRTNLLLRSEEFDNATWSKTRCTVSANAVADPLGGTTTADKLAEQTDSATNRNVGQNISVTSGTTYTLSVYAKQAERPAINLRFATGFAAGNVTFNLASGTKATGGAVAASAITALANDWYRCSASFTATSTTTAGTQIYLSNGSSITFDGTAGQGVYLWGAQVETGALATGYIATAGTTASAP